MENYNQIFRDRTKKLSLEIIRNLSKLPYSEDLSVIRKQIYRSSTSTACNYRAVGRARSDNERFAKMCIVVEEADENLFWLELIRELEYINSEKVKELMDEANEILKVMAAYKKKLSDNLKK